MNEHLDIMCDTPLAYARRMARYITCATTIRVNTLRMFGRSPELGAIKEMQASARRRPAQVEEPTDSDGNHWAVKGFAGKARVIQADARDFAPPAKPEPNPYVGALNLTQRLCESVAKDFGITADDILGDGRKRVFVNARAVVIKLLSARNLGVAEIGRRMKRDHTTISYTLRMLDVIARRDPRVSRSVSRHLSLQWKADVIRAQDLIDEAWAKLQSEAA